MPVIEINGANINYAVLGDSGPWVVLTPGGRSGMEAVTTLGKAIGKHACSAVGVASLPSNVPIEIEMVVEVEG